MSNLEIYNLYGFKFFPCNPDKTPATRGDWRNPTNHLTAENAEELQKTGQMIGAWIPENVIVIDLDMHSGKKSGKAVFNEIVTKYNVNINIGDTFAVKTGGGGLHIFFTTDKEFRQNSKAESIDLRTHKGYVIAAGSPGYHIEWDSEIKTLPFELEQWLFDCEDKNKIPEKKDSPDKNDNKKIHSEKKLSAQQLKKLLEKIPATNYRSNDKWIEFIISAVAICGESEEIYQILTDWSMTDPEYQDEQRNVSRRIKATHEKGGITTGTFIYHLRDQNIPNATVTKILKLLSINEVLTISEKDERKLPFTEPDYISLSVLPCVTEFFNLPAANTAAATILEKALFGKVIYVAAEKKSFYFDGNKWQELYDIYTTMYTILYRVIKNFYHDQKQEKENYDYFIKCIKALNSKTFKVQTWEEFTLRKGIYNESIEWDAPEISETITCSDGVIDFRNYTKIKRQGLPREFRRTFIDCKVDDIMSSKIPIRFNKFLSEIFPDEKTNVMAKMLIGLSISGNASKRLFQLWNGGGRNGKSVLLELIHYVLGNDKAYKHETELIIEQKFKNEKYDQINFRGKYFCYSSEINKYQKLNGERIKDLTGYEIINARQIFEKRQIFRPTWQLVFVSNDLPDFTADFAIIDRIMILPFEVKFYKTDEEKKRFIERDHIDENYLKPAIEAHKLMPELKKERHAIINYMIDNYIELQTAYAGMIPVSNRSIIKKQKYIDDNDETSIFIKEYCFIDFNNEKLFTTTEEIAECYRDFVGKNKLSDRVIIDNIVNFDQRITRTSRMVEITEPVSRYDSVIKKKQRRGLKYIGLLTNEDVLQYSKIKEEQESKKEKNLDEMDIPF